MKTIVDIKNIAEGGCSNCIHKSMADLKGAFAVKVDLIKGSVAVDHTDEVSRTQIVEKLKSMGYEEKKI
ncbi:MAG: heavy metal-associated domain-containing protein [Bacteroidales bacterium]